MLWYLTLILHSLTLQSVFEEYIKLFYKGILHVEHEPVNDSTEGYRKLYTHVRNVYIIAVNIKVFILVNNTCSCKSYALLY